MVYGAVGVVCGILGALLLLVACSLLYLAWPLGEASARGFVFFVAALSLGLPLLFFSRHLTFASQRRVMPPLAWYAVAVGLVALSLGLALGLAERGVWLAIAAVLFPIPVAGWAVRVAQRARTFRGAA
jgi:hypothetical protein